MKRPHDMYVRSLLSTILVIGQGDSEFFIRKRQSSIDIAADRCGGPLSPDIHCHVALRLLVTRFGKFNKRDQKLHLEFADFMAAPKLDVVYSHDFAHTTPSMYVDRNNNCDDRHADKTSTCHHKGMSESFWYRGCPSFLNPLHFATDRCLRQSIGHPTEY